MITLALVLVLHGSNAEYDSLHKRFEKEAIFASTFQEQKAENLVIKALRDHAEIKASYYTLFAIEKGSREALKRFERASSLYLQSEEKELEKLISQEEDVYGELSFKIKKKKEEIAALKAMIEAGIQDPQKMAGRNQLLNERIYMLLQYFSRVNVDQMIDSEYVQYPSTAFLEEKQEVESKLLDMTSLSKMLPISYNEEEEYKIHQKVGSGFFRRVTRNKVARSYITRFLQEQTNNRPINLDGLSSRTRILLFRELTTLGQKKIKLPFVFHGKAFEIVLKPTENQPGNGIITGIISSKNIVNVLGIYTTDYQKVVAKKLLLARGNRGRYHQAINFPILQREDEQLDLEMLNILLDFEVARRLQGEAESGTNLKKAFDSIPIASAIRGILKLPETDIIPLMEYFHTTNVDMMGPFSFPFGEFNVFQGQAERRAEATKRIIKKLKGNIVASNSSEEQIHKEYLEIFGGESESEDESET